MAQSRNKRKTKHRGTQAGNVEARGRTSRPTSKAQARAQAQKRRVDRASRPPSWRSAINRAGVAVIVFIVILAIMGQPITSAIGVGGLMFFLYVPLGYGTDKMLYDWRAKKAERAHVAKQAAKLAQKNGKVEDGQ